MNMDDLYLASADTQLGFIAEYYGVDKRLLQLMEECGELVQACSKLFRAETADEKAAAKEHLAEEIADVEICAEQAELLLGLSLPVDKYRHAKLQREIERIDKKENGNGTD